MPPYLTGMLYARPHHPPPPTDCKCPAGSTVGLVSSPMSGVLFSPPNVNPPQTHETDTYGSPVQSPQTFTVWWPSKSLLFLRPPGHLLLLLTPQLFPCTELPSLKFYHRNRKHTWPNFLLGASKTSPHFKMRLSLPTFPSNPMPSLL